MPSLLLAVVLSGMVLIQAGLHGLNAFFLLNGLEDFPCLTSWSKIFIPKMCAVSGAG
jgi:hypothetical protein